MNKKKNSEENSFFENSFAVESSKLKNSGKSNHLTWLKEHMFQARRGTKTTPVFYHIHGKAFWGLVSCNNRGHNATSKTSFSVRTRLRD